jgi:hypothetical protein
MLRRTLHISFVSVVLIAALLLSGCAAPYMRPAAAPAAPASAATEGSAYAEAPAAAMEEPAVMEAAPATGGSDGAYAHSGGSDYQPGRPVVTAGVVDDNDAWSDYLDYLDRHSYVPANRRDVAERYVIRVADGAGRAVLNAKVKVYVGDAQVFEGRTDSAGRVLFHPNALDTQDAFWNTNQFRVVAEKGYGARSEQFARYGSTDWVLTIDDAPSSPRAQLDLVFMLDATGSMADEIQKLKSSMASVAEQIDRLPEHPDVRYGLVAFRDVGDEFVVNPYQFTSDLNAFQRSLANTYADGGGDTPESVNEALHRTLNELDWRQDDTLRLVILVGDAPPHLDYDWQNYSYDTDMIDAVRRGIKIFPVGASNLDEQGEYIFRQLAQFTGGKFVFLTYKDADNPSSGPGAETTHDVENYSVSTLDKLIVKLVREELAHLAENVTHQQSTGQPQQPQSPLLAVQPPSAADQVLPVLCVLPPAQVAVAATQKLAGADYIEPVGLTNPLPAALLRSAQDGDILCGTTFDGAWSMARASEGGDYAPFLTGGQPFWVWGENGQLMQGRIYNQ